MAALITVIVSLFIITSNDTAPILLENGAEGNFQGIIAITGKLTAECCRAF
jgi:hypothetical protein